MPMLDSMDSQRGDLFLGLALLGPIVNLLIALDLRKIYQDKQTKINVHGQFSPRSKMTETTKWEKNSPCVHRRHFIVDLFCLQLNSEEMF